MINLKKLYTKLIAFHYVSKGYVYKNAKAWFSMVAEDKQINKNLSHRLKKQTYKNGYTVTCTKQFDLTPDTMQDYISQRDYLYLMPLNSGYQKWLKNLVTIYYILQPYHQHMLDFYYHLTIRDGKRFIIPFSKEINHFDYNDLKDLLIKKQTLDIITPRGILISHISYQEEAFYIDDKKVAFDHIVQWIEDEKSEYIIVESKSEYTDDLTLYISNTNGNNPEILDSTAMPHTLPQWNQIVDCVNSICNYLPQLEYMGITFRLTEDDFYIENLKNNPAYFIHGKPSPKLTAYLQKKLIEKRSVCIQSKNILIRGNKIIKRYIRKLFARIFYPAGLKPYISYTWIRDIWMDFRTQKEVSLKDKLYAYRNGFLSYRLKQYNITEETRVNCISDFEYKWLRHINSDYRTWLEDKNTLKYIITKYRNAFPEYYYYIDHKNDATQIIGLRDCPKHGELSFEDILDLVRTKGSLALKPDEGSHGDGFYRCEYIDGQFFMNFVPSSAEEIIGILNHKENAYIITEYINMHPELQKLYSGSVNTLRVLIFKKDGRTPEIGNVYMRIGTSQTGAIDNMSAGGMYAAVDEITGEYGDAKRFVDGNIIDCPIHPDTGVEIAGILPNWENTKQLILNIATEIKQLEFFGFDLAITEDGIKIPEINRSPDFPKIEKYTAATNAYLMYKLERKKELYGYENNKCRKLIGLPRR